VVETFWTPPLILNGLPTPERPNCERQAKAVRQGHDPQLEKAVQVVMEELEKNPLPRLQHPPYPTYHR